MSQDSGHYYVPAPSTYPIIGSSALLFLGFGAALTMNKILKTKFKSKYSFRVLWR